MKIINLFDANFAGQECSVLGKTPRLMRYERFMGVWDGITMFTDGYLFDPVVDRVECRRKIGWLHEPQCLWPHHYRDAPKVMDKFDFILTYYEPLLDAYPDKFRFCPYGGIWLPRETWGLKTKTKNISMLIGSKKSTTGHIMRHEVHDALVEAGLDKHVDFYGVYGEPVDYGWQTKYRVLADYRYSIVCEACDDDSLFTEILLDCFAVGTTPIFWGAKNLGSAFPYDTMRQFGGPEQAVAIVKEIVSGRMGGVILQDKYGVMVDAARYEITEDWMVQNGIFDD